MNDHKAEDQAGAEVGDLDLRDTDAEQIKGGLKADGNEVAIEELSARGAPGDLGKKGGNHNETLVLV